MYKFCKFCNTEHPISAEFWNKGNECKKKVSIRSKQCRSKCREARCAYMRKWHQENKHKDIEWNNKNRDKKREHSKKWKLKNRSRVLKYAQEYNSENREKLNIWKKNDYHVKKSNPAYKIVISLRNRLRKTVLGHGTKHISRLGCSRDELRAHLESKFLPGMTWSNYGSRGWHIDHIRPLSSFNLMEEKDLSIACHYTNLQPLWAKDNLKKGDNWTPNL